MAPTVFPPPIHVSPTIKFFRWSFLLAGIVYGKAWHARYTSKELALRDIRLRDKANRDKKLAEEKARASAAEIAEIERMVAGH